MERRGLSKFCFEVLMSRWTMVVVSFFVMACSGATYIFSIYSGAIKSALHYNQQTIDTLAFFKDLGANVGIVSGLVNEVTPAWAVLAVGAVMNLFGYLMIWLSVTRHIARPPVWQMYVYMCVGANSQTFANTGVIVTCVKNFPQSRGIVIGLLKGFVGLSGAIFTQIYHAVYGQDTEGVILLIGWLPAIIAILFMFFIRPMKPETESNENRNLYSFLYLALLLAGFLMIIIIVENQVHLSQALFQVMAAVTVLLLVSNVWIAVRTEKEKFKLKSDSTDGKSVQLSTIPIDNECRSLKDGEKKKDESREKKQDTSTSKDMETASISSLDALPTSSLESPVTTQGYGRSTEAEGQTQVQKALSRVELDADGKASGNYHMASTPTSLQGPQSAAPLAHGSPHAQNAVKDSEGPVKANFKSFFSNWPERGDDFTIPQALLSLDMWILFLATTCGVGATLTAIDNMGQIGDSLGYSKVSISTFVSLISIWNFLGRVIAGFSSEILLQRYRFPRTFMLTIVLACACVAHLLIAFPTPGSLYLASILVGLCFGAQWPLLFSVISELFGLKYFATLYNCGGVASPVGSYVLSVRVAGYLYDREARKQHANVLTATKSGSYAPMYAPAPSSSDLLCYGSQCFRNTFIIMAAVSLFGSLVSAILALRTREFYKQDIYAKFRNQEQEEDAKSLQQ